MQTSWRFRSRTTWVPHMGCWTMAVQLTTSDSGGDSLHSQGGCPLYSLISPIQPFLQGTNHGAFLLFFHGYYNFILQTYASNFKCYSKTWDKLQFDSILKHKVSEILFNYIGALKHISTKTLKHWNKKSQTVQKLKPNYRTIPSICTIGSSISKRTKSYKIVIKLIQHP